MGTFGYGDYYFEFCMLGCGALCVNTLGGACALSLECTEDPDECAATFEYYQDAAIEFCEEYPEQCQEAFDAWAEAEE